MTHEDAKLKISLIISDALFVVPRYRHEVDGKEFIKWALVESDLHSVIDGLKDKQEKEAETEAEKEKCHP